MRTFGFGIVGTGVIGEFHAKAVEAMENARLVACCEVNEERARQFAAAHGCAAYTSMEEFLRHPELEIVTVATPSGAHLEPAVAAAEAGKHVIVEKPLEITVERCDRIIERCDRNGVTCAGVFPSRFFEGSRRIREALDQGRFGRLILGDAVVKWFRSQEYYDTSPWKGTWKLDGGGALMNQSIHSIDLLQWFMGPVESVQAYMGTIGHTGVEVEDTAVAAVRFSNGALGIIEGTTAVHAGFPARVEVHGAAGNAVLSGHDLELFRFADTTAEEEAAASAGASPYGGGPSNANDPAAISFVGHQRQFEDLVAALEEGRPPLVDGQEARKAVAIIQAVYESARQGHAIAL